jgi:pyruvate dehydrogenase E1 component alpha subunit
MSSVKLQRREAVTASRVEQLFRMYEIRAIEDRVAELFREGLLAGTTHTCHGQEAVAVGIAAATAPTDHVMCTYRGHGLALALGMTPQSVLGEVMGRRVGAIHGLGGSMHLADPDVGLLPTMAIVGVGIPIAVGAALTATVKQTGAVTVCVFGDGATNIGAFHEGLNLAAIWRMPVVFICENNLYGEYSPLASTTAVSDLAVRGASYGIESHIVDGQDVDLVTEAVAGAVKRARGGGGPQLLEMKTYRFAGHSRSDPATYRPAGELETWLRRDPIVLLRDRIIAEAALTAEQASARERSATEAATDLMERLRTAETPTVKDMFEHVYAPAIRP